MNNCAEPYAARAVVPDPRSGVLYLLSTSGGILMSADRGAAWKPLNRGLPSPLGVNSLALDPYDASKLYASSSMVFTVRVAPEAGKRR
jgi:hypothetical protein